MLHTSIGIVIV